MTVLCDLREELRMCADVAWVKGFGGLCCSGFEGGLLGAAWVLEGEWVVCVIIWFCRF